MEKSSFSAVVEYDGKEVATEKGDAITIVRLLQKYHVDNATTERVLEIKQQNTFKLNSKEYPENSKIIIKRN